MPRSLLGKSRPVRSVRHDRDKLLNKLRGSIDCGVLLIDLLGVQNYEESGDELIHSCILPFGMHSKGDSRPSASLNRNKLCYCCFVCGGGDIFWLVATVLDISINEAIYQLSGSLVPREMSAQEFLQELESYWEDLEDASISLPSISDDVLKKWRYISPYLSNRGIDQDLQIRAKTGVDMNNRDQFFEGGEKIWIEQPRVVIPLYWQGHLRGWQKRKIDNIQVGPKYRFSPGFPRNYCLYGADWVQGESVIVVESALSVLRCLCAGLSNVVATYGVKVTNSQIDWLRQFDEVTICFDNDAAGHQGTSRLIDELTHHGKVKAIAGDPGDIPFEEITSHVMKAQVGSLFGVL